MDSLHGTIANSVGTRLHHSMDSNSEQGYYNFQSVTVDVPLFAAKLPGHHIDNNQSAVLASA